MEKKKMASIRKRGTEHNHQIRHLYVSNRQDQQLLSNISCTDSQMLKERQQKTPEERPLNRRQTTLSYRCKTGHHAHCSAKRCQCPCGHKV